MLVERCISSCWFNLQSSIVNSQRCRMTSRKKLTYSQAGVDYSRIDPIQILAQKSARATGRHVAEAGFPEIEQSRGESAYVIDAGKFYLASITECLGTRCSLPTPGRSPAALISTVSRRTWQWLLTTSLPSAPGRESVMPTGRWEERLT
jgi:hypothetical protein